MFIYWNVSQENYAEKSNKQQFTKNKNISIKKKLYLPWKGWVVEGLNACVLQASNEVDSNKG